MAGAVIAIPLVCLPVVEQAQAQQDWGGRAGFGQGRPGQGQSQGMGQGRGQLSPEEMEQRRQQRRQERQQQNPDAGTASQQQQPAAPGAPAQSPPPAAAAAGPAPMVGQETSANIDELLDQTLVEDPGRIAEAKKKMVEQPPRGADDSTLSQFYFDRARAADLAGDAKQLVEDLRKAAAHGERAKTSLLHQIYYAWSMAERAAGRTRAALDMILKAIDAVPPTVRGRVASYYSVASRFMALTADLPGAENALRKANSVLEEAKEFSRGKPGRGIPPNNLAATQASLVCTEGSIEILRGRFAAAEAQLRKCLAMAEPNPNFKTGPFIPNHRGALSRVLMAQGRLNEAEAEARQALLIYQRERGAASPSTAQALAALSIVLGEQGRIGEAGQLARKASEIMRTSGLRERGSVRQSLISALAAQGRWQEASAEIDALFNQQEDNALLNDAMRNPWIALALLKSGKAAEAVKILQAMIEKRAQILGDRHYNTAEARGQLGLAYLETGDRAAAKAAFERAVPVMLQRSREADDDTGAAARDTRLRMILEGYMRLLSESNERDAAARTFQLAEAARGRSVERAVAASAARFASGNPKLAVLAREEQDTQRQISALNSLLSNAISARAGDQNSQAITALRAQIDGMRDTRARLAEQIEKQFPDYAALANPHAATVEIAQKSLKPGEALVSLYTADDRTYVWAVPAQGPVVFAQWKITRAKLDAIVAGLRKSVDPQGVGAIADVPAFDVAAAHGIYAGLLQPTEAGWRDAKSIVLVSHGSLAQLPLGLLPTQPATIAKTAIPFQSYASVPWLARKVAIAQMPSVASLQTLRALPPADTKREPFVGFGDPWFNAQQAADAKRTQVAEVTTRGLKRRSAPKRSAPEDASPEFRNLPRLPETADEVRSIAKVLQADAGKSLHLGAQANKTKVQKENLAGYRVVMFATHGLVPGEIAGLAQPALALSGPDVTPDAGNGLLTMEEVLGLKLDADWVVLSACNTGSGQGAGSEAISGLGRAFFYAGTRALLVSNWPVETVSARLLTTDIFSRQAKSQGMTRAEALRQSMLALMDGPGATDPGAKTAAFSYAHPMFWAAFSLIGDGGG